MALPPRAGARQVMLGNPATYATIFPPGSTVLPTANPTHNSIDTEATFYFPEPAWPPRQQSFSAYQDWYSEYPNECVVKVSQGVTSTVNYVRPNSGTASIASVGPTDIVYEYDPAPPVSDPVPDPNGTTGNFSNTQGGGIAGPLVFPRWHTDAAYNMAGGSSYDFWRAAGYFPLKSHDYIVTPAGGGIPSCCSASLTVTNLQSKVLNLDTDLYEYYDFQQATFDYTQTGKLIIPLDWEVCCWNNGTVITGMVAFSSLDVTTEPLGDNFDPNYGFQGMTATTGTTVTAAGTAGFTVTINSGYSPVEITVPTVAGSISFISDFWITSVVAPT